MKSLIIASVFTISLSAPVQAQSINESLNRFCTAIRQINAKGISAAPGTAASQIIAQKAGQGQSEYRTIWQFASFSGNANCRSIW
jgi:hypothetical protein